MMSVIEENNIARRAEISFKKNGAIHKAQSGSEEGISE